MAKKDINGDLHSEANGQYVEKGNSDSRNSELEKAKRIYSSDLPKSSNEDPYARFPTIKLPVDEYAEVMSELATNLTKEEHTQDIAIRHIGNYTYKVRIYSFGHYRVIGKWKIRSRRRKKWNI